MKVLIDLHHLGGRATGNETWGRGMAAALAARSGSGLCVDLALAQGTDPGDFPVDGFGMVGQVSGSSTRRLLVDLPRLARRLRSDALLVQYTMPLTRLPTVVAIHDLSFEQPEATQWLPRSTRLRYRATIRASARRAAHVLALSEHTRRDLIVHFGLPPERVTVVYPGLDRGLEQLIRAQPRRPDRGPRTVLVVGTVLPRKNLPVVAQAVAALRAGGLDVRLQVVGPVPPPGRVVAAELAELLPGAVNFTGYVDRVQLARAYAGADVLAFPSLYEGFGLPVLEAMATGLPVVVSDASSLPEIAGDAASPVPATDVSAWTPALRRVLDDPAYRLRLVAAGRRRAAGFTWERAAAIVDPVLRRVSS